MDRNRRRVIEGVVVSNKMDKTAVVEVIRKVRHPQYEKLIEKRTKLYAHCDKDVQLGQKVQIMECRPISRTKRWRVIEAV
jgi:small subunit ribosomal protein S17